MRGWMFALLLIMGCKKDPVSSTPVAPTPAGEVAEENAPPPARANGEACAAAADCASGICEGQGCDEANLGVCVSEFRACTADLAPFCDCDGANFSASSSCPGRRYAAAGTCPSTLPGTARAVGEACLSATECASGICEGQGCGDDTPGVCAPAERGCTRDLVTYCGCDGQEFRTSGSCPGQRYAQKGTCPE